jgi:hypothetical protein
VSDLLRKALIIATKLKLNEFENWINNELNGYPIHGELPRYRILGSSLRAWNIVQQRWLPLRFTNPEEEELATKLSSSKELLDPISSIEHCLESNGDYPICLSHDALTKNIGSEVTIQISKSQFRQLLEGVRNTLLRWTLKLEEEGIIGTGMSFSQQESVKAENNSQIFHIQNYIVGGMHNSPIQQDTVNSTQISSYTSDELELLKQEIPSIKEKINDIKDESLKKQAGSDLATIEVQVNAPNPTKSIINTCIKSLWSISEKVGVSLIANEFIKLIPHVF